MKKEWVEPRIEVQKFTPNEYVAACYYFKGTHIILRQKRPGTDGRTKPQYEWQGPNMGFKDDGWDFLSYGNEDNITAEMPSGWYSTSNDHPFIVAETGDRPLQYDDGGPWGNTTIKDTANTVYYYGGDVYDLTPEIAEAQGVGLNAS